MKRLLVAIAIALSLTGCSSSLHAKRQDDGSCVQERTKRFLGVPYSTNQYRVNCASS